MTANIQSLPPIVMTNIPNTAIQACTIKSNPEKGFKYDRFYGFASDTTDHETDNNKIIQGIIIIPLNSSNLKAICEGVKINRYAIVEFQFIGEGIHLTVSKQIEDEIKNCGFLWIKNNNNTVTAIKRCITSKRFLEDKTYNVISFIGYNFALMEEKRQQAEKKALAIK